MSNHTPTELAKLFLSGDLKDEHIAVLKSKAVPFAKALVKAKNSAHKKGYQAAKAVVGTLSAYARDIDVAVVEVLAQAQKELGSEDFETLMDCVNLSYNISVWGSDSWAPRVLFNGSVVFRNHHRVIGFDEALKGSIEVRNTELRQDLATLVQELTLEDIDFSILHHDEQGIHWTREVPAELSSVGQTLVVLKLDTLENAKNVLNLKSVLFNELLESAAEDSRSQHVVLRVYKDRVFVYSTYRAGDEYDTVVEEFSYFLGETTDEGPVQAEIFADASAVNAKVKDTLQANEPAFMGLAQAYPELYPFLEEKLYKDYVAEKARETFAFSAIFNKQWNTPTAYYAEKPLFFDLAAKRDEPTVVFTTYITLDGDELQAEAIADKFIDALSEEGLDPSFVKFGVTQSEAEVDSLNEEELVFVDSPEFLDKIRHVVDEIYAGFQEAYSDTIEEGDDGEIQDSLRDYLNEHTHQLHFVTDYQVHELDELMSLGKRLSGSLSRVTVHLPAYGILQNFDEGDLDSGNSAQYIVERADEDVDEDYDD